MTDYPYILKPGSLKSFIESIPERGVPEKVTQRYLNSIGFTSTNDRPIVKILKFINMLDNRGVPTDNYREFRDRSKSARILAQLIRTAYSELFDTFPDAFRKDREALKNFFSAKTDLGDRALDGMVDTFQVLCELSDFEAEPLEITAPIEEKRPIESERLRLPTRLTLNVNIQIQLPLTDNTEIYDKIFESLRKNILSPD